MLHGAQICSSVKNGSDGDGASVRIGVVTRKALSSSSRTVSAVERY